MKRLTLMRHAEARWQDATLSDLERPLNKRGRAAAEAMARRLKTLGLLPDLLLVSPALRTRQSAEILVRELELPARRLVLEEKLYLAGAVELLRIAHATAPRITHLLLLGHNPGLSELAGELAPQADGEGLATAALCSISFSCERWDELAAHTVHAMQREAPPAGRLFGLLR